MDTNPFKVIESAPFRKLRREIAKDQVTHPMDQYQPGSPHLERLFAAMEQAQRYDFPDEYSVNL